MDTHKQPKVAVVGLGAQGLVTVKNLLEQGFDVTGFEKNKFIGGIWHYSAESRVSVLPSTIVNVSRERACFTDFPFPDGTDSYPTSGQVQKYLNGYADHFDLRPHLRLGTAVTSVRRDDENHGWLLTIESQSNKDSETIAFDRLIMAVGPHSRAEWPSIEASDAFKGEISHGISYKDPIPFKDKRVMVIGISNSAADTATSLVGIAKKIYLAHRDSAYILPRHLTNGAAADHGLSYRIAQIIDMLGVYIPSLAPEFIDTGLAGFVKSAWGTLDPSWNLDSPPSVANQLPTVSDALVPNLRTGTIVSTGGPVRIVGDHDVELSDGTVVQVDSIICCTGYNLDLSILGQYDPSMSQNGAIDNKTPKLYQNIFSLQYPDSLAFVGMAIILTPAFLTSDLSTMAIAQLWSNKPGSPSLPSQRNMEEWYERHVNWVASVRAKSPTGKFFKFKVEDAPWLHFVETTAGTNIRQNLSYTSLEAWKLWLTDFRFGRMLMDGILSPHLYRFFPSERRKAWPGAREAILKVNDDIAMNLKAYKAEQASGTK